MIKGDSDGIAALFATEKVISEVFDCENEETLKEMFENLTEGKKRALRESKEGVPEGITVKYTGFETTKSETMPAGTEDDGCKLKADIIMIRGKVKFDMIKDGETDSESERIEIANINGKHYLVEM